MARRPANYGKERKARRAERKREKKAMGTYRPMRKAAKEERKSNEELQYALECLYPEYAAKKYG